MKKFFKGFSKGQLLLLVITSMVLISSLSYAYFTTSFVQNNVNENIVVTGSMAVEYDEGPQIEGAKLYPGNYFDKTFSVKNIGNVDANYTIYLNDVINNFSTKSDLVYELITEDGQALSKTVCPSSTTVAVSNVVLPVGETHHYTLRITFLETGVNQNDNLNKVFSARVELEEEKALESTPIYSYLYSDPIETTIGENEYNLVVDNPYPYYINCNSTADYYNSDFNTNFSCIGMEKEKYVSYANYGLFENKNQCESYINGNSDDTCEVTVEKGNDYQLYQFKEHSGHYLTESKAQEVLEAKYNDLNGSVKLISGKYGIRYYTSTVINGMTARHYNNLTKSQCEELFADQIREEGGSCEQFNGAYYYYTFEKYYYFDDMESCNDALVNSHLSTYADTSSGGSCAALDDFYTVEYYKDEKSLTKDECEKQEAAIGLNYCVVTENGHADDDMYSIKYVYNSYNTMDDCEDNGEVCTLKNVYEFYMADVTKYDSVASCQASSTYQETQNWADSEANCVSSISYDLVDTNNLNLGFSSNELYKNDTFVLQNFGEISRYSDVRETTFNNSSAIWSEFGGLNTINFRNKIVPLNTSYWFKDVKFNNIENIANLKTDLVTDMSYMFAGNSGSNIDLDLKTFNTQNVTNMEKMFYVGDGDVAFSKIDLSSFTTTSETNINNFVNSALCFKPHLILGSGWQASRDFYYTCGTNSSGMDAY